MTSGTYPWSFVTQIFHCGQPSHGDDRKIFEVMTSTSPKGTLGTVTLCQQQPSIKEILIGTTSSGIPNHLRDRYSICRCCWNVAIYKWKVHNGKIEIISSVVMFRSVGQGMKQTYLYLWYPLRNALLADKSTLYYQESILHGYMNNTRTINTYFINFLLSVVRLTIYKSTQIMMFENKEIDINYFYLQCTNIYTILVC